MHQRPANIRRLPIRLPGFEVDAVGQARDEVAAFGVELDVHRLQQNRDGLAGGLDHAAVFDDQRQRAFAARDFLGQIEADRAVALGVNFAPAPLKTSAPSTRAMTLLSRPSGMPPSLRSVCSVAPDLFAGAVAVAQEDDLAAQARRAIGADVELAFGRRVAVPRIA